VGHLDCFYRFVIVTSAAIDMGMQVPLQWPDFKVYCRAWYWYKNRYEDQWNRIEDLDMNLHSCIHLIFDKDAKNVQWRKDRLFNKCFWERLLCSCRKPKLDPCLSSCTISYSNWIKDLNIRPETLNLVQDKTGNTLEA
jgi:hypothetical protein